MADLSTKQKGEISELRVAAKMSELGTDVYFPFGESTRSDLIADTGSNILKVQVKTAWMVDEGSKMKFNCSSTRSNFTETTGHSYDGDVDGFVVFNRELEQFFWVSIEDASKRTMYLRLEEPKNGQQTNVNMAENYRIEDRF